jgi:tetraacyldisaccharide 4'-kinase
MPDLLNRLYDEVAWRRRAWFLGRSDMRRRLRQPVISVGALAVGGSGKTPLTAHVARLLVTMGERPAILSRGYRRADPVDGVVVVRTAERAVGDLATAGDEPWMLAQALDGVSVVVAADRYLAGRLAETHLGATVHLLDDGFQHLQLERCTDLLVVSPADLDDPRVLPGGRLRERLATARHADAVLVPGLADRRGQTDSTDDGSDSTHNDADWRAHVAQRLRVARCFSVRRHLGSVVVTAPHPAPGALEPGTRVLAVAGIARPDRFFDDVRDAGFDLARTMVFRDHHDYTARDVSRVQDAARAVQAQAIVTTDKDLVRFESCLPFTPPLATMSLTLTVEPAGEFRSFLAERLAAERSTAA